MFSHFDYTDAVHLYAYGHDSQKISLNETFFRMCYKCRWYLHAVLCD